MFNIFIEHDKKPSIVVLDDNCPTRPTFLSNPLMCENRIKTRVLNDGHNIPKNDIIRRFYRSKFNFINLYKDIVDEWNIFYNGSTKYVLVAKSENGSVEIFNDNLYNEFVGIE